MSDFKHRYGRLIIALFASAALFTVVVSCQDGQKTSSGPSTPSAMAEGGAAADGEAMVATTQPGGGDETSLAGWAFPPAPAKARPGEVVARMNNNCVACHTNYAPKTEGETVVHRTMHATDVGVSCVDCHGGHWEVDIPEGFSPGDRESKVYKDFRAAVHVHPRQPRLWGPAHDYGEGHDGHGGGHGEHARKHGGNPELLGAFALDESRDFVRFINPGDLRAAHVACGACHNTPADGFIVDRVQKSMMAHGAMLWGAALYNNGTYARKNPLVGEFYTDMLMPPPKDSHGQEVEGEPYYRAVPARVMADPRPTMRQYMEEGMLPQLYPIQRWEISLPGNILRVFERGGRLRPVIGIPNPGAVAGGQGMLDDPGRPDVKLSIREVGTDLRTDPVTIGLQKTRLFDPTLNMMGTNDQPGDYRASGCSSCHVVYANDRSPVHSAQWAKYGNMGESFNPDDTVNPPAAHGDSAHHSGPTTQPYEDPWAERETREEGHPINHVFVKNMPSSQCITCHIHPGTLVSNSYLGYMWWDNESDGEHMYPKKQKYPTGDDHYAIHQHNPEGSAARGLWSNHYPNDESHAGEVAGPNFLEKLGTPEFNSKLKKVQFGDFHGHGWIFRAVYKMDREGHYLDHAGQHVGELTADKMKKGVDYTWDAKRKPADTKAMRDGVPVHLKDVHLEMGMQCVDCHFETDNHGNGHLHGETRNETMIECIDCHGAIDQPAKIAQYLALPSGRRSRAEGENLLLDAFTGAAADNGIDRKAKLKRNKKLVDDHFVFTSKKLVQKSAMDPKVRWNVVQTNDTVDPGSWWSKDKGTDPSAASLARFAHTVRKEYDDAGKPKWGELPKTSDGKFNDAALAHGSQMSCYACHTSWNTSCFGCHLPQRANQRRSVLHNEGLKTRNYTNYNYQTLRDDVYMLGIDSTVKGHKIVPIRSACAVLVSSQDALRQWIYTQQQTVSAEGFSGTAFSPYFPHTVRSTETKGCTDCHLSSDGDNNAVMAQLLLHGTNAVNFIGRFAWVGGGKGGLEAIAVTERDEPQAVIGSTLHALAYPDFFREHEQRGKELKTVHTHHGTVLDVQQRGEYLYAACGPDGFIAYDVANIDNKGFSERIITAPVSPFGQRFYVDSKYATSITSPSTMAIDPTRPRNPMNEEGKITVPGKPDQVIDPSRPIHLMYAFLYMTDKYEGVIVIGNRLDDKKNKAGVATLLDGDPKNNFLERAKLADGKKAFNPNGVLTGARSLTFHGHHAYVCSDAGVVVIDFDNPLDPKVVTVLTDYNKPKKVQFQFRYGFVVDADGVKVMDVTNIANPRPLNVSVPIADARDLYITRTYGYVAAGSEGLYILNLTKPEAPTVDQVFNDDGHLNDAYSVKVGMTNSSMFAYVADGKNGLKVIQLTSADTEGYMGFSPKPQPRVIAHRHTHGPARVVGEGLDRDRAVDEAGNQLSVFGRRGARPFTLDEQMRLYRRSDNGEMYFVKNSPENKALAPAGGSKPSATTDEGGDADTPRRRPSRRPRR